MPGQVIGDRYEVQQQLGRKSGRWTLLANDLQTDTPVILKLLFMDDDLHPTELKLFKREIDTLQTLSHPAIPQYLSYFEITLARDGKALALIQTYKDGVPLSQWLERGQPLNNAEVLKVAQSVLEILDYLHNHQPPIVHRDIKPSNILLSDRSIARTDQISLVDFGSVKSFGNTYTDQTSFTLIGTTGYCPPEQVGRRAVRASDLYGLGMTLLVGLTSLEPTQLPQSNLRIHLDQIEALKTYKPAFVAWLKRMVEPDLDQRFNSASVAYDALMETL